MDKSMLADLDSLPEADKLRMSTMIDQLQIRDRSLSFFHRFPSLPLLPLLIHVFPIRSSLIKAVWKFQIDSIEILLLVS
jgi:hypothetical protein